MNINGYEVEIKNGGIKVGCTFVPLEKMKELVEGVENCKNLFHEKAESIANKSGANSIESTTELIQFARTHYKDKLFLGIRRSGEYEYKGFFVGGAGSWKLVEDSDGLQVLIKSDD